MNEADSSRSADQKRLMAFAYCWADFLLEVDPDWRITYASGATDVLLGIEADLLLGRRMDILTAPGQRKVLLWLAGEVAARGRANDFPLLMQPKPGRTLEVRVGACSASKRGHLVLSCRVAAPRAEPEQPEPPRFLGPDEFSRAAARSLRGDGESRRLTFVDVPGMDRSRDRLGELGHETLLQSLAAHLRLHSADGGGATQLGQGRFGVLQAGDADPQSLRDAVSALVRSLDPGAGEVAVAQAPLDELSAISEDDMARSLLYGLSRFGESAASLRLDALADSFATVMRRSLKNMCDIKAVTARQEFHLVFQPIVDLRSSEIHHFEALSRFKDGQSPFELVRFAEDTGAAPDLDLAVLGKVLDWVRKVPVNSRRHRVAVNVSGASVNTPRFLAEAERMLRNCPAAADKVMFEITESARIDNLFQANSFIQHLRAWGFPVCLDDFGAGTASFQYLSVIDVDIVKLDGSAIRNARSTPRGMAFLSGLTQFCRRLGTDVVAEQIDSRDLLDFCVENGCALGQGYLFGKPADDVAVFRKVPAAQAVRRQAQLVHALAAGRADHAHVPLGAGLVPAGGWPAKLP